MMAMKCGQIVDNLNQIKNSVTFLMKEFNGSQGTNSFNKVASSHGELVDDIREMIHSFQLLLDCNVTQFIMSTFTSEDYSALIEELQMQYPVTPMTPLTPITPITPITPVIIGGTLTSRKLSFSRTKSQRKRDRLERLSISVDLSMAPAFQEMQNQGFRLTPLTLTNDLNQTRSTGDVFSFEDINKLHGNVKKQHPKFMKHSSEPNVLSPMRSSKDNSPNRFTPGTHNSRRSGNSNSNNYDRHARFDDNVHMDNLDFGFELDMIDDGCHFENYKSYKNGKEMRKNVNNNNDDICNLDYNEIDKMIGSFGQEFGKVGGFDGLGIDVLKNNHFKHTTTTTGTSVTTVTTDLGDTPTPTMLLFHENQNMVNLHGKNNKNNKNDNNKNNNGNNNTAMEYKNSIDGGNVTTTNEMEKRKDDQLPQETNESEKAGSNVDNQTGDNNNNNSGNNNNNDARNEELFYVHERKLSKIDTMSMQSGSVHSGNNKSKSGILSVSDNDTLTDNEDAAMTMATQQSEMTDILNSVTPMSDDGTINTINTITTINTINTINTLNNNMTNTGNNNNGNNNSKKNNNNNNNNNNKSNNNGLKQNSLASMASASLYKGGNPSLHDRMSSLSIHLDGNGMSLMSHDTTRQHKTRYHDTIDSTNDEFLFLGYAGGDSPNSTTRRDSMSSAALFDDAINEPLPRDAAACYMNHNNNNNNNNNSNNNSNGNSNTHNTMNNKNSSSLSNKYKTGSESASESSLQRRNGMYLCENGLTNVKNHKNSYNNDCNNEEAHISNISPSDSSVPDIITPPPARSSKTRNLPHISEEKSIGADNDNNNSKNVRHFERQRKQVNEDRESFLYN